jgi:hypothetical protein
VQAVGVVLPEEPRDELPAARDTHLFEHGLDVIAHRVGRQEELGGDLSGRATSRDCAQDLALTPSPWHQWLDPEAYRRHVDEVEAFGVLVVASAHGPVMTGGAIHSAFDSVRALAGRPYIPTPGQELLDELIATTLVPAA